MITNKAIPKAPALPEDPKDPKDPSVQEEKSKEGSKLPETATPIFNYVLVGIILLLIGIVFFRLTRRKEQ